MFNNFHRPTLYLVGAFAAIGLISLLLGNTQFTLMIIPVALVTLFGSLILGARANRLPDDTPEFTKNSKKAKRGNLEVHDLDQAEKDEEELIRYEEVKILVDQELEREKAMAGSATDRFIRKTRVRIGKRFPRFLPSDYTLTIPFAGLPEEGSQARGQFVGGRKINETPADLSHSPFGGSIFDSPSTPDFNMPNLSEITTEDTPLPAETDEDDIVEWEIDPIPPTPDKTISPTYETSRDENVSDGDENALPEDTFLNISLPSFLPKAIEPHDNATGANTVQGRGNTAAGETPAGPEENIVTVKTGDGEYATETIIGIGTEPAGPPIIEDAFFTHEENDAPAEKSMREVAARSASDGEEETSDREDSPTDDENVREGVPDTSADPPGETLHDTPGFSPLPENFDDNPPTGQEEKPHAEEKDESTIYQYPAPPIRNQETTITENSSMLEEYAAPGEVAHPVTPSESIDISEQHAASNGADKIEEGITVEEEWVPETVKPKRKSFSFFRRKDKKTQEAPDPNAPYHNALPQQADNPYAPAQPNLNLAGAVPPPSDVEQTWFDDSAQQPNGFGTYNLNNQQPPAEQQPPAKKKHFWNRKKKNQDMVIPYGENKATASDSDETPEWLQKIREGAQGAEQHTLEPELFNELLARPGAPEDAVASEDALLQQMRNPGEPAYVSPPEFDIEDFSASSFMGAGNPAEAERAPDADKLPEAPNFFAQPSTAAPENIAAEVSAAAETSSGQEDGVRRNSNAQAAEKLFSRLEATSFVAPFAPATRPPQAAQPRQPHTEATTAPDFTEPAVPEPVQTENDMVVALASLPDFGFPQMAEDTGPAEEPAATAADDEHEAPVDATVEQQEDSAEDHFSFAPASTAVGEDAVSEGLTVKADDTTVENLAVEEPAAAAEKEEVTDETVVTVRAEEEPGEDATADTYGNRKAFGPPPLDESSETEEETSWKTTEIVDEDEIVVEIDEEYVPKRLAPSEPVYSEKSLNENLSNENPENIMSDNGNVVEDTTIENVTDTSDEENPPMEEQHEGEYNGSNNTAVADVEEIFDTASAGSSHGHDESSHTAGTEVAVTEVTGEPVLVSDPKVATIANQIAGLLVEAEAEAQNALAKQMEELRAEAEAEKLALEENWQKVVDQIKDDAMRERKALEATTEQQIREKEERLETERALMEQEKERLAHAHEAELATKIEKKEYERVADQNERLSESLDQAEKNLEHVIDAQRTVADAATMSAKLQAVSRVRKIRQELAAKDVPPDVLEVLDAFVNDFRN